jgi:hypothetical protein
MLPPPTERMNRQSLLLQLARAQPLHEDARPALVVRARGQLGDVVGGGIGLNARDLAEVVHRVGRVGRAAADAQHEEAPAVLPHGAKLGDAFLAVGRVDLGHDLGRFL